jgi:hypothetical protein
MAKYSLRLTPLTPLSISANAYPPSTPFKSNPTNDVLNSATKKRRKKITFMDSKYAS